MIEQHVDIAIIGAGPAGLAAAVAAKKSGANNVLVLDRNHWLGGILPQCIHDGFGVEETGHSMTGPEYAEMYIEQAQKEGVKLLTETMVLNLSPDKKIVAVNKEGLHQITAKAVILAMGCREKTRWNIQIPGDRPSGIFTAGVVQGFINLYNLIPGKNIIILGSGDVGLIMARRLKLEGANVLGVVEILPHPSGLPRNIVQCLDDYDIPLFLRHTVTHISGKNRLQQVTIAEVDNDNKPISGTEQTFQCDTLILSLGLIPENELSTEANVKLDLRTGGAIVDQYFSTTIPGIYSCGNCLHVYDTVDMLAIDAAETGKAAANYITQQKSEIPTHSINIQSKDNIRSIVPQQMTKPGIIRFLLRSSYPQQKAKITFKMGRHQIAEKTLQYINPATMIQVSVKIPKEFFESTDTLEVSLI